MTYYFVLDAYVDNFLSWCRQGRRKYSVITETALCYILIFFIILEGAVDISWLNFVRLY